MCKHWENQILLKSPVPVEVSLQARPICCASVPEISRPVIIKSRALDNPINDVKRLAPYRLSGTPRRLIKKDLYYSLSQKKSGSWKSNKNKYHIIHSNRLQTSLLVVMITSSYRNHIAHIVTKDLRIEIFFEPGHRLPHKRKRQTDISDKGYKKWWRSQTSLLYKINLKIKHAIFLLLSIRNFKFIFSFLMFSSHNYQLIQVCYFMIEISWTNLTILNTHQIFFQDILILQYLQWLVDHKLMPAQNLPQLHIQWRLLLLAYHKVVDVTDVPVF